MYRAIRVHKDFNVSMLFDITERKNAMHELKVNQLFLQKAQEIGIIGTWHLNLETNVLLWTKENYKIFGIKENTPINYELFINCVHPEDRVYVDAEWKKGIDKKYYDIEHRVVSNGEIKWVREKADFVFDDSGAPVEAFGVTQDISKSKEYELKLKEYTEQLSIMNQDKDDFISILAHDLKNHLHGLVGISNTILKNFDNFEKSSIKEYMNMIHESATKTKNLLLQTLQWVNPETNVLKEQKTEFSVLEAVNAELNLLMPVAETKNISISTKVEPDLFLYMNKGIFDVVTRNIIGNAIKFTPRDGRIEIRAIAKKEKTKISISDTGVGMTEENIGDLFKSTLRNFRHGTDDEEGTGLGLRICNKLLKTINSRIEVQSSPGKGSTFSFSISNQYE